MDKTIVALKIGGTACLGILTGVHLNFSTQTLKAILSLGSPTQAQKAFSVALGLLRSSARPLELIATTSLATAWFLSPRTGKHPYLWFASAPVLISIALERLRLSGVEYGITSTQTMKLQGGSAGGEVDEEVNGEVIKDGIDQYQHWVLIRGGIIGSGFLMSLVGLYGDHK
ncbi:hypothetical protein BZA77DRAFT_309298 [Pyronema omphalodes]|nr:hypothetical protein BZA77DRAFT_309298 [Pyronema omphalodes]